MLFSVSAADKKVFPAVPRKGDIDGARIHLKNGGAK